MLFVQEVFGIDPYPDQIEFMRAYDRRERRIAKRSGHGVGKTTVLAWLIIHHMLTRYPQKTVCTAPTSAQLFDALAAETKSWINKLPPLLRENFDVKSDSITHKADPDASFISFRTSSPEKPEALAGVHSDNVLLVCDEASGIPEQIFEAASGSMSGHNAITILAGNPVRSSGLFYDIFHKMSDTWATFRVSCVNHPNIAPDFVEDMARRYGENSNPFRVRVLGEFPLADDDTVIPYELAEPALTRDVSPIQVNEIWGLDVARFGSDRSALARRKGNVLVEPIETWRGKDLMEITGIVKAKWDATVPSQRPEEILVDAIGLGAGVADRLRELGLPCRAINVGESAAMKQQFLNLRAELWWKAREWFMAKDVNIAGDDKLMAELVAVKYKFTSAGKIQIESKDDFKKRNPQIGSPDVADAFILTLASEAASATHGSNNSTSWKKPLKRMIRGIV